MRLPALALRWPCGREIFPVPLILSLCAFVGSAPLAAEEPLVCGQPATPISAIQGSGSASPLSGETVEVEAVVVGDFQGDNELEGLFLQEEEQDGDGNDQSSEGLFAHTPVPARVGDRVRARGVVTEFEGLTGLNPVSRLRVCASDQELPPAIELQWPPESPDSLESLENMRLTFPHALVLIDTWSLGSFGELAVSADRWIQAGANDRLIIDDGRNGRNLPLLLKGQDNLEAFSAENPIRTGQTISGLSGVLHYAHGKFRLQLTSPLTIDAQANPRTDRPEPVGGSIRIASFNVLNYFSGLTTDGPVCGRNGRQECRGADSPSEQARQLAKLSAALGVINADILGLIELENNAEQSLKDITRALNAALGEDYYDYIRSGSIGQDVIKVGLLFKPATVNAVGGFTVLDHLANPLFDDTLNRPVLAQSFREPHSGEILTVAVTHLKSKSCSGAEGENQDQGNGQGCFNPARVAAVEVMADWILSDPTGSGSGKALILGDFNSYRIEDPIQILQAKGLVNLLDFFQGERAYTYVYSGIAGTLDYAFSTPGLAEQVTGATAWHINADEPAMLDYNEEPGKPADYYSSGPYRSSDHDPVIIGLGFPAASTVNPGGRAVGDSKTWLKVAAVAVVLLIAVGWWASWRRRFGA